MNRINFGVVACAAAALLGWAGLASAQQRVVLYTSNEATLNKLIASEFEKATGIAVDVISAGSGVVIKRLQSEKDRPQGDLVWGISRSLLQTNAQYFDSYASEHKNAIPAEFRDSQDRWIGTNLHLLVVLQNTKSIPEAQGPKTWDDLTTPRFKGNIAFTDPANSGSAYSNVTLLVDLWGGGNAGWSKVEKLFANTRVLNRSALVFQGVGNGEYGLGISLEYAGYLWASNGAPVKVVYPADGTIAQMEGVAIIKGGPNTAAARRFVDYVNRRDVREMILKQTFRRPARQDLDLPSLPGKMPRLSDLKLVKYDEEGWTAKRGETMDRIKETIQKTRGG
jgi:iron(III) transport system substrate-binding protein